MKNFDHDILFEFIPEEDKKYFMVWDNVFCNPNGRGSARIVAIYRAPFEERLNIPFEEYQMKLKQKEREIKLNKIL
jgi:hypothetical protein